jgi:uncharacterized protein YraI
MKRVLSFALAAVASSGVMMAIETAAASATGAPIQITQNVNMRSGPGTSYARVGGIYAGQSPDFVCWTTGENIGGVDVWFDVNANGASGHYASYYDKLQLRDRRSDHLEVRNPAVRKPRPRTPGRRTRTGSCIQPSRTDGQPARAHRKPPGRNHARARPEHGCQGRLLGRVAQRAGLGERR